MPHTAAAVAALLRADPSVAPAERKRLLQLNANPEDVNVDRIIRPQDAAKRLVITRRTLGNWLRDGTLPPVKLPGRKHTLGVRESDLAALIAS